MKNPHHEKIKLSMGLCRLTGEHGKFVNSHLIPRALTILSRTGEKHIETGIGLKTRHRASSWYDNQLCTRAGEDLLEFIDTAGISLLRKLKLVWSGWDDNAQELVRTPYDAKDVNEQTRAIRIGDSKDLRLFFISLLWRAAATNRPEFDDVQLEAAEIEDLRLRVLSGDPGPATDFPIQLFQLRTKGPPHNRTPLLEKKPLINDDNTPGPPITVVRFYFDGLICHIHIPRGQTITELYMATCLCEQEITIVFTHPFDESRTKDNIVEMVTTVTRASRDVPSKKSSISNAVNLIGARPSKQRCPFGDAGAD